MNLTTCPMLHAYAETIGVQLVRHDQGGKAWYHHPTRTISTRRGLSIQADKSSLAHELAHATYGDEPTGHGHYDLRQEQRADKWAANVLIDPQAFEDAYIWHRGHLPAIADELEVTHHILDVWINQERKAA